MQDIQQETVTAIMIPHDTYSSAHTTEWVNMENHRFATFTIITGGTCTAGVKMKIQKATNASGSSAANVAAPWVGNVYYTNAASTGKTSMVQTAHSSSGSVGYIPVGTTTSCIYQGTVDAATVTSDSKAYISIVAKGNSASSMDAVCVVTLWGSRYQNETGWNALA